MNRLGNLLPSVSHMETLGQFIHASLHHILFC